MPKKNKAIKKTPRIDREKAIASTTALCKELACITAFHISNSRTRMKIYKAIRQLQTLAYLAAN